MMLGVVDVGLAIVYPAMLNWGTIQYLRELKFRLIEVPPEEFVHYGCNILTLAPGKIVIPAAAKQTIAALRREGMECLDLDLSQSSNRTWRTALHDLSVIAQFGPQPRAAVAQTSKRGATPDCHSSLRYTSSHV